VLFQGGGTGGKHEGGETKISKREMEKPDRDQLQSNFCHRVVREKKNGDLPGTKGIGSEKGVDYLRICNSNRRERGIWGEGKRKKEKPEQHTRVPPEVWVQLRRKGLAWGSGHLDAGT